MLSSSGASWAAYSCQQSDVVVPGGRRYSVLRERQEWAAEFWRQAVSLKRTRDPVTVSQRWADTYRRNTSQLSHPGSDLVIIMLARPSPNLNIAAFAQCLQTDQFSRCTVGVVNTVPAILDVEQSLVRTVISSERQTATHEMAHLLGAVQLGLHWLNASTGYPADVSSYATYEPAGTFAYPKPMVRISSPRVLAVAREAFGCPTLSGVPLEDYPLGAGVHWESRVLGPEFMSYGSSMGEEYVSDLTLAMLEDTNQFIANYSMAGPMIEALDTPLRQSAAPTLLAASQETRYTPPEPRPPGFLRWGRGAGCDFVNGAPGSWPEHYLCRETGESGCTPDNREGAVCTLRFGVQESDTVTCAAIQPTTHTNPDGQLVQVWTIGCESTNDNCVGGSCAIPSMYQYFGQQPNAIAPFDTSALFPKRGSTGALPGNTGGASAAMDYLPVRIKFWNCGEQATVIASNNRTGQESVVVDGSVFADRADLVRHGGQEHCRSCRCFRSSLLQFDEGLSLGAKRGLCYRANCYRSDYLQVGVKGLSSGLTNWYACPKEGGSLLIAGYTGSLECPPAEAFCVQENISGIRYAETSSVLEWVLLGTTLTIMLLGVPVLLFPCLREPCVRAMKRGCAVHHFDENREILLYGKSLYDDERAMWEPDPINSSWVRFITKVLTVLNVLFLLFLLIATLTGVLPSHAGIPVVALTLILLCVGVLGWIGARGSAQGASCAALSFIFMGSLSAVLVLAAVFTTGLSGALAPEEYMDRNWQNVCDFLHSGDDSFCTATLADRQLRAEAIKDDRSTVLALILGACCLAVLHAGLQCAAAGRTARMIHSDVLIAVAFASSAYFQAVIGFVGLILFGFALSTYNGPVGTALFGTLLGLELIVTIVALLGVYGMWKMDHAWLLRQFVALWVLLPIAVALGIALLVVAADVSNDVRKMTDSEAASSADGFGLEGISQESFALFMQGLFQDLGIGALVVAVVLLFRLVSSVLFSRELRIFLADRSARIARQERRLRAMGFSAHFAESREVFDIRYGFEPDSISTPILSAADRTESWHAGMDSPRSLAASKASAHSASVASIARMVATTAPSSFSAGAFGSFLAARGATRSAGRSPAAGAWSLKQPGHTQNGLHRIASDGGTGTAYTVHIGHTALPPGNAAVAAGSAFPLGEAGTPMASTGIAPSSSTGEMLSAPPLAFVGQVGGLRVQTCTLPITTKRLPGDMQHFLPAPPIIQTQTASPRHAARPTAFDLIVSELRLDACSMRSRMQRPLSLGGRRHRSFVNRAPAEHRQMRHDADMVLPVQVAPRTPLSGHQRPAGLTAAATPPRVQHLPVMVPAGGEAARSVHENVKLGAGASLGVPQPSLPPPAPDTLSPPHVSLPSMIERDISDLTETSDEANDTESIQSVQGNSDLHLSTLTSAGTASLRRNPSGLSLRAGRPTSLVPPPSVNTRHSPNTGGLPGVSFQVQAPRGSPFHRAQQVATSSMGGGGTCWKGGASCCKGGDCLNPVR